MKELTLAILLAVFITLVLVDFARKKGGKAK